MCVANVGPTPSYPVHACRTWPVPNKRQKTGLAAWYQFCKYHRMEVENEQLKTLRTKAVMFANRKSQLNIFSAPYLSNRWFKNYHLLRDYMALPLKKIEQRSQRRQPMRGLKFSHTAKFRANGLFWLGNQPNRLIYICINWVWVSCTTHDFACLEDIYMSLTIRRRDVSC
jgi:hypothetical protein